MRYDRAVLHLLSVVSIGAVAAGPAVDAFLAELKSAKPEVQWDASTAVTADFNGDGESDFAVIGYPKDGIVLAVDVEHGSTRSAISYLSFAVDREIQAAVCVTPVHLSAVPLSCDANGVSLPGCVEGGASGLSIADDECDAINLYWNKAEGRISWWRN